jgi:predicted transcriptional regulator
MAPRSWYEDDQTLAGVDRAVHAAIPKTGNTTTKDICTKTGLPRAVVAYRCRKLFYLGFVLYDGSVGRGYVISRNPEKEV